MSVTLFYGKLANGEVKYLAIPIHDHTIGLHIAWLDAVSSAAIVLEMAGNADVSASTAGTAAQWKDSGVTVTGPTATAIDSALLNIDNVRQAQARLKITAAAVCYLDITDSLG